MRTRLGRLRHPSPALVVAVLALVVAAGGVATGAIPDNGVIHGCYDNTVGRHALYVRDTNESCQGGQTSLDWNATGPPGPPGPPGSNGADGTNAVQGPPGSPVMGRPPDLAALRSLIPKTVLVRAYAPAGGPPTTTAPRPRRRSPSARPAIPSR